MPPPIAKYSVSKVKQSYRMAIVESPVTAAAVIQTTRCE